MNSILHDSFLFSIIYYFITFTPCIVAIGIFIYLAEIKKKEKLSIVFLVLFAVLLLSNFVLMGFRTQSTVRNYYVSSNNYALNTSDDVLTLSGNYMGKVRIIKGLKKNGSVVYYAQELNYENDKNAWSGKSWEWKYIDLTFQNMLSSVDYRDQINVEKYQEALSRWENRIIEYDVLKYP